MSGRLVLLVSYPKSGNTWTRAFFTALWRDGADVDINHLIIPNASSRNLIDKQLGMLSSDLGDLSIAALRPAINGRISCNQSGDEWSFMKVHDAYLPASKSHPIPFARDDINRVIYLVRDPRDIALSFARHLGCSVDSAISAMEDTAYRLSAYPKRIGRHVPQFLSSWSAHVDSWINAAEVSVRVIRYEDMLVDPASAFGAMLTFLDVDFSTEECRVALEATHFSVLQKKERLVGFREKPRGTHSFFHGGVSRAWESELSCAQRLRIEGVHGAMMARLGYAI